MVSKLNRVMGKRGGGKGLLAPDVSKACTRSRRKPGSTPSVGNGSFFKFVECHLNTQRGQGGEQMRTGEAGSAPSAIM